MGNDLISMKLIKKLSPNIIPHIVKLINVIITTKKYPKILKISRITPTLKPDKLLTMIDSYRPINNLPAIEKIIEQYF